METQLVWRARLAEHWEGGEVEGLVCWLDQWQTLISGLLAIAAAGAGAFLLSKQIRQTEEHENRRLKRRLNAVRATLPLTLSGLGAFADDAFDQLLTARNALEPNHIGVLPMAFEPPVPPSELVGDLKQVIEATDDAPTIDLLCEILSEIQTLHSRMQGLADAGEMRGMLGVDRTIDQYLIQTARLSALIEGLYDFARRRSDSVPQEIGWDRVTAYLSRKHVEQGDMPSVYAALNVRMKRLTAPWPLEVK